MTVFHLTVDRVSEEDFTTVADAHGDLDAMAYHTRRLKDTLQDTETYRAELTAADAIFAEDGRTVASVTGDPEVVIYVLQRRLRTERAERNTEQVETITRADAAGQE